MDRSVGDQEQASGDARQEVERLRLRLAELEARLGANGRDLDERSLASFAEWNPAPVLRCAHDGTILHANPAARDLLRVDASRAQFLGELLPELKDVNCYDCIASGSAVSRLCEIRGRTFQFLLRGLPSLFVAHAYGADVTARIRAEEALRESERRLTLAARAARIGIWEWRVEEDLLLHDETFWRFLGYDPKEAEKDRELWRRVIHPDDRAPVSRTARECLAGLRSQYFCRHRLMRWDGNVLWVEARGEMVDTTPGRRRMMGTVMDVTGLRDTEIALAESEGRFRSVLEHLTDIAYRRDLKNDRCDVLSPSVEAVTGYTVDEFAAMSQADMGELVHPDDRAAVLDRKREALEGEAGRRRAEYRLRTKRGDYRWLSDHFTVLKDERGAPRYRVGVARDITWRKQAEAERLRVADQRLQAQKFESLCALAGGVAHHYNNLMQAITGHVEMALEDLGDDAPARKDIERVYEAAERARALSLHMLACSGRAVFDLRVLPAGRIVESVEGRLRSLTKPNLTLSLETSSEGVWVAADTRQIGQAVFNIVENAVEAIREAEGRVTVNVSERSFEASELEAPYLTGTLEPGSYACFLVEDDGPGMGADVQERLFDPFFSTKFVGRGLGMAAALGIARAHGGAVLVESEPGLGTRVRLLLPVAPPPEPDSSVGPSTLVGA